MTSTSTPSLSAAAGGAAEALCAKRILFVIPRVSSFQAFLSELGAELVACGADVRLVADARALPGARPPVPAGVGFHSLSFPRGPSARGHLAAARQLARLVDDLAPDLVHAHFSAAIFTAALSTLWWARRGRRPALWGTFQGLASALARGPGRWPLRAAESFSLRRADAAWVLTQDDATFARALAPGADVRVQRAPGFGCRTDVFARARVDGASLQRWRLSLGLAGRPFTLLYAGRFVEFKGYALTVRAFLRFYRLHRDARLILAGAEDELHPTGLTPQEEAEMRACPGVVRPGFVADLQNVLALCDAMVFPSRREGMPVCIMESLAMQVPVVTLCSRGCRDLVRGGANGVILPDERVETLVQALCDLRARGSAGSGLGFDLPARPDLDRGVYVREQVALYRACLAAPRPAEAPAGSASDGAPQAYSGTI